MHYRTLLASLSGTTKENNHIVNNIRQLLKQAKIRDDYIDLAFFANNVTEVEHIISKQRVRDAKKRDYFNSIACLLNKTGFSENSKEYHELIGKYTVDKELSVKAQLENIAHRIDTDFAVKIMCLSIIHNIPLSIKSIVEGEFCPDRKIWLHNIREYHLTEGFISDVGSQHSGCLLNANQASSKFRTIFGLGYSKAYSIVNDPNDSTTQSDRKTAIKWEELEERGICKSNINKLQHISTKLFGNCEYFYWYKFNQRETLEQIKTMYSNINTAKNYITALTLSLEATYGSLYSEYELYRMELEWKDYKEALQREVPAMDKVFRIAESKLNNSETSPIVKVFSLMITHNLTLDRDLNVKDENCEFGILRPSDIISTKFKDDGEHSYIDVAGYVWYIRSKYTKNRVERCFPISKDFIDGVKVIYQRLPTFLIENHTLPSATDISNEIKNEFGYNFSVLRSAYFTWRSNSLTTEREKLATLCYRQGHQYSTAMMNYLRKVEEDE